MYSSLLILFMGAISLPSFEYILDNEYFVLWVTCPLLGIGSICRMVLNSFILIKDRTGKMPSRARTGSDLFTRVLGMQFDLLQSDWHAVLV